MELIAFVLVSFGIIVIPGPNVLVVVSTSISHGRRRGLQTVAGTSMAMVFQLAIAALGTTWLVSALTTGFFWLKWAGVSYLVYLGLTHLLRRKTGTLASISALGSFQRGFWVSLTNPKTILFFSAFLPQFTNPASPFLPQIVFLSLTFWLLAVILDSAYALLASRLTRLLSAGAVATHQQRLSGLIYLFAAIVLAASRKGTAN